MLRRRRGGIGHTLHTLHRCHHRVDRHPQPRDRASPAAFFEGEGAGTLAGLFTPGSVNHSVSFREDTQAQAEAVFQAKFRGPYWAVHAALPHLARGAAVVLMSGAALFLRDNGNMNGATLYVDGGYALR